MDQLAIMRKVNYLSDTDLYTLAEQEAEKWVDCPQLPLNDVFRKFLTGLRVNGQNGHKFLAEFLDKNLSYILAEKRKPVGELYKLVHELKGLIQFHSMILQVCEGIKEKEDEAKLFARDALVKEFIQHFIAHTEYSWTLRYDRRHSIRGQR